MAKLESIQDIIPNKANRRKEGEEPEEFEEFINSIKTNGIIQPILIDANKKIIDGHRRLVVAKKLKLEQIPCEVMKNIEDIDNTIYFFNLNAGFAKELNDIEKAYKIAEAYELAGYTKQQALQGVKYLDNRRNPRDNVPNKTTLNSRERLTFRPDSKFIEVCNRLARSPSSQYKYLRVIIQMDPEVLEYADKQGLNRNQKVLLTHTKLQKHPEIQKITARKLKGRDDKTSQVIVHQTVRDLETGYIAQDTKGEYHWGAGERELLGKDVVPTRDEYLLDISSACEDLLKALTGHKLGRSEVFYRDNVISNTEKHRIELIKSISQIKLSSLTKELEPVKLAVDDMLEKIADEWEARENKDKILTQ